MTQQDSPWRITFDTNPDDCNLHCIMCEGFSKYSNRIHFPPRLMDFRIIKKVVEEMAPIGLTEIIPSTMGEPLLYDHFDDIIKLCYRHSLKLNLTTNGTWPKINSEQWANKICPIASDVKVSWNGATKETQEKIMPGSQYEKRLEDLQKFIKARDNLAQDSCDRCTITLQVTFLEMNLSELPQIVALASKLEIDRVKGHHVWAHFPEIDTQNLRRNSEAKEKWNKTVEICTKIANNNDLKLDNFYPLEQQTDYLSDKLSCPFLGKEAWINAEGRFDPCCAPDEERKTLGYFGTISQANFREIWSSQSYQELKASYMHNQVCQKCNMRRPPQNG